MSVLHVRCSSGIYGAENVLLGLLPELSRLGAAPRLLCIDSHLVAHQSLYRAAVAAGLDAQRLPSRGRFDTATLGALSAALTRARADDPDTVIHTHDYKSLFFALLARRGRDVPIVATSHGHFASTGLQRAWNALEVWMMRRAAQVLIVSEAMRPILTDGGIAAERITLVENGIDTRRFDPDIAPVVRASIGRRDDELIFGAAIRLNNQKHPLGLLDAFAQTAQAHPQAALVIAGDGPLHAAMTERIGALGIGGRVSLIGARDDLPALYPMFDVFVLPSLYEGLPLALLEAMAAALPVIATRVGHVPIVLDGLPAALVAPGDIDALAAAMCAECERPRRRMPELRARVRALYSAERMAHRHMALYRNSLAARRALATR